MTLYFENFNGSSMAVYSFRSVLNVNGVKQRVLGVMVSQGWDARRLAKCLVLWDRPSAVFPLL